MTHGTFPTIVTDFDDDVAGQSGLLYRQAVANTLRKILPPNFFQDPVDDSELLADLKEQICDMLPLVITIPCDHNPRNLSFFMLGKYRTNAFKFFFEMISHWLVPGKRLDVIFFYAADFKIKEFGSQCYTVSEIIISVDDEADLPEIHCNLPIIEMEAKLGIESAFYARRILEIKGLSPDEKTVSIQENMAYLVRRLPKYFSNDIFTEMQHILVLCSDEFKKIRDTRHLSRIISFQYLFRKNLLTYVKELPDKRHLMVKLFNIPTNQTPGKRIVVGVLIGVNFIKDKEVLEEQHILTAIRNYIPAAKSVVNSFFFNKRGVENICTLYLEIEKDNEHPFSCEEIRTLRKELPGDLKDRIGHLMHPVFMPRNEEEIVKNILNLSNQVKFIRDLPQVFITFDEQSHSHLYFTVILVRVVRPCDMSVEDLFKESDTCLEYIHDRCKMVGMLRRKYAKEATVFRLKLPNVKFLRQDHSIDLYKARLNVVTELSRVIGDFRDYNGGMISKQNELLCAVRDLLKDHVKYNDLLLENFFYSLTPVVMRTVLAPETLKTLFLMLLEAVESGFFSGESYSMSTRNDKSSVYAMVTVKDRSLNEQLTSALNRLPRQPAELASSFVIVYDIPCFGYIYRNDDPQKQELFLQIISETLETWKCREAVLT